MREHIGEVALIDLRPRFQDEIMLSSNDLCELVKTSLNRNDDPSIIGQVRKGYIQLQPSDEFVHYWSPFLSISLEEVDGKTIIRGFYGPRPSVWTMFVFFYSIIAFALVIVSVIGFANLSIDKSGKILWLIPVLVIMLLSLYLVSYFGQKKGMSQMRSIHLFFENFIGHKVGR
jgi:hypothetical protein